MDNIIDFEAVYLLFENDEESVVAFFTALVDLVAETQTSLKNYYHTENWTGVAEALHKIKSTLPYFCDDNIIETTVALESAAKENNGIFVTENLPLYISFLGEIADETAAFLANKSA